MLVADAVEFVPLVFYLLFCLLLRVDVCVVLRVCSVACVYVRELFVLVRFGSCTHMCLNCSIYIS